jgi:Big-like domain-containing protein
MEISIRAPWRIRPPLGPRPSRRGGMTLFAIVFAIVTLSACGEQPLAPDQPLDPGEAPSVATIDVSSAIGAIIATSGSSQLTATALDQAGQPIATVFTWTSSDDGVATVSAAGAVTGAGPGTTTIAATSSGVSGALELTVAETDLASIQLLLDDPHLDELLVAIGGPTEAALRTSRAQCGSARAAGDLTSVLGCVTQARADLAESTDASKGPLVALVGLFVDWIDRLLNLP